MQDPLLGTGKTQSLDEMAHERIKIGLTEEHAYCHSEERVKQERASAQAIYEAKCNDRADARGKGNRI